MPDFRGLPKQWVISTAALPPPQGGRSDSFAGLSIAAADGVPIQTLTDAEGGEIGRLIGWPILSDRFCLQDGRIALPPETTTDAFFAGLGGRFVMLWRDPQRGLSLREDAGGGLPAVVLPEAGLIAATVTLADQLHPLPVDPEVEAVFDFPPGAGGHGYLPFGLTPRRGARRLMPNHVLELAGMTIRRDWPGPDPIQRAAPDSARAAALMDEIAALLTARMAAILAAGTTGIFLSAGHDSRAVLAAARAHADRLTALTLAAGDGIDAHVAARVAQLAGIAHRVVPIRPSGPEDTVAWLHRSGRMMHAPVTALGPTALAMAGPRPPIAGTGAELLRGSSWDAGDIGLERPGIPRLLSAVSMPHLPDVPVIRRAARAWLDGLPPGDTILALDLAKIEQVHGCWAGPEAYGHPLPFPTVHPFSGRQLHAAVLALPLRDRLENRAHGALLDRLWPELRGVPVNRAEGLDRLRFWRTELRRMLPPRWRARAKALRHGLRRRAGGAGDSAGPAQGRG